MSLNDEIVDVEKRKKIVKKFQQYVNTYNQDCFLTEETFINDMLYGIGTALDKKNEWFPGFHNFKKRISKLLENFKIITIVVSWRK